MPNLDNQCIIDKSTNNDLPWNIHSYTIIQEVTFLSLILITWQELEPLLVNKKSDYNSFKMNIDEYVSDIYINK